MFNPLEGRILTMTRTVREKAIGLLTKAVSDYSGNEKKNRRFSSRRVACT